MALLNKTQFHISCIVHNGIINAKLQMHFNYAEVKFNTKTIVKI